MRTLTMLLAFLEILLSTTAYAGQLQVQTTSGTVHGFYNNTERTVRAFLGVPYAEAPTGGLRFAPPVLRKMSSAPMSATTFGPLCPSENRFDPGSIADILPYLPWGDTMAEDCLKLNIWTPSARRNGDQQAAVMMFIHGGAFTGGGSSIAYFDGTNIVQDNNDIIVVTLNYRLGVFGFPNAPGLRDGEQNVGIMDQRLAVEWVHKNIAKFGGDPARIMLFGQSAGSISTDMYTYAYYNDPIIHAAAMQSGTASLLTSSDSSHRNWNNLSKKLGCATADPSENLQCMRDLPFQDILSETVDGLYFFIPVQDNKIIFADYESRTKQGKVAKIATLMGSNERESSVNYPLNSTIDQVDHGVVSLLTQIPFQCPTARSSIWRVQSGVPVWRYIYHGNWTNISPAPFLGAYHSSELPMIFGTYYKAGSPPTPEQIKASEYIQGAWVSFARDPESLSTKYNWPKHKQPDRQIVDLALENALTAGFSPAARWDTLCGLVL
ncbi:hypothetical protein ASPCAL14490 [Aspergillus calidoustus]|uniref:Carboxylic ester hydrolase n=1 Tax=Aspergillus calidoustus TaxID=454130 RepID=A0A0U5CJX0_ASPCI|nr:hypothetical protein ASPCAL14490 [Aspergillus calidoustus]